jgi:hypothetical protein
MAKNPQKRKASIGSLTPAQQKAFQAQLDLQERVLKMATAQADREQQAYESSIARQQERAEREAQFNALNEVAKIYSGQAGKYGKQFDDYSSAATGTRDAALRQLMESAGRSEKAITGAETDTLANLIATKAYRDIPVLELGQQQNPLLAGLAAEGASTAGVEQQSAQDAQIAAQLAAMTRGAMGQLNLGEENYLKALQNAVRYEGGLARQDLAGRQFGIRQGIGSEYDQLAQRIAQQRLESVSGAESKSAEALAQAQGFAPIEEGEAPAAFDYNAALENARRLAMQQVNKSLPFRSSGNKTPTTNVSQPTGLGRVSDLFGKVTVPYQKLPKGATLTDQQIKRLAEAQDIQALRQRGL